MAEIEKKYIAFGEVKSVDDKTITVVASDESEDRQGEVIKVAGWSLANFKKNPVMLVSHDYTQLPIGTWEVHKAGGKLTAKATFSSIERAKEVETLVREGILSAVSVGFIVKERNIKDPYVIEKAELLEISWVSVPANPNALQLAMAKGFSVEMKKAPEVEKNEKLLEHYKEVVKEYRELLKTLQEKHQIEIDGKVEEVEQIKTVIEKEIKPKEVIIVTEEIAEKVEPVAVLETPVQVETPLDKAELTKAVNEALKPYLNELKKYI